MAQKIFIAQIESVTFPGNEYNIKTSPIIVPEIFACYLTAIYFLAAILARIFEKLSLRHMTRMT